MSRNLIWVCKHCGSHAEVSTKAEWLAAKRRHKVPLMQKGKPTGQKICPLVDLPDRSMCREDLMVYLTRKQEDVHP